jgi:hypothetical protein
MSCHREGNTDVETQWRVRCQPQEAEDHTHARKLFSRNWEIAEKSLSLEMDRSRKARCHNPDMHVTGKPGSLVAPAKQANKAGPQTAAESVEKRRLTKKNASQPLLIRTQSHANEKISRKHPLSNIRSTPPYFFNPMAVNDGHVSTQISAAISSFFNTTKITGIEHHR